MIVVLPPPQSCLLTPSIRAVLLLATASGLVMASGCGDAASGAAVGSARPLAVTRAFGEVGLSPGQFAYPRAIDADGSSLYIIDKSARVQRIDPKTGQALATWTMPDHAMGKPCGVTVGPDGLVYVADTHYFRVMAFRPPDGMGKAPFIARTWGEYGEGPGQFIYPTDIAFLTGPDGWIRRIYVSEYGGNDRVSVFDSDLKFLFSFGRLGESASPETVEFNRPESIAVDSTRGRVVVADACNHRIGVFTLDGELVRWIGSPQGAGGGLEQFAYPYGLVLRPDGTALVSEFGNHRVHHVDLETGATLGLYGAPGRAAGELTNPWGIAAIGDTVYVLDSGNARVQGFKLDR